MKAQIIGFELVPDYTNKNGIDKKGGFKLYIASDETFSSSALCENRYKGVCPLKNSYWISRESKLLYNLGVDLLKCNLPLNIDVTFNYMGYIDKILVRKED